MEFLRLPGQDPAQCLTGGGISGFAAKTKMIHTTQSVQDLHSSLGEILGASAGPAGRQLQHSVGSSEKGHTGPGVFVKNSGSAPLDKVTAHDHKDIPVPGQFPGFFYLIAVSFVKRIVFCNNSCNAFHINSSFYKKLHTLSVYTSVSKI